MRFSAVLALAGVAFAYGSNVKTEVVTTVVTQDCLTSSTSTSSALVSTKTWFNGTHTTVTVIGKPPQSTVTVVGKPPQSTVTVSKPPQSTATVVKPPQSTVTVVKPPQSTVTVVKPPPSTITVAKPPQSTITLPNPPHSTITIIKPPQNATTTRVGLNTTTTKGGSGPNPTGTKPPVVNAGAASMKASVAGLLGFAGIAVFLL